MDWVDAVRRASAFAAKSGDWSVLRFLPAGDSGPVYGHIQTFDGKCGSLCPITDLKLEHGAVAVSDLLPVCKLPDVQFVDMSVEAPAGGPPVIIFRARHSGRSQVDLYRFALVSKGADVYPDPPWLSDVRWDSLPTSVLRQIWHAVPEDRGPEAAYAFVRISSTCVESADRWRMTRAEVDLPWGLWGRYSSIRVPGRLLGKIPREELEVGVAVVGSQVLVRVGSEIRYGPLGMTVYPDLNRHLEFPVVTAGAVGVRPLRDLVKRALSATHSHVVSLHFDEERVRIEGWRESAEVPFQAEIEAHMPKGWVLVNGEFLVAALAKRPQPAVWLSYGQGKEPLRLFGGNQLDVIYPLWAEETKAHGRDDHSRRAT